MMEFYAGKDEQTLRKLLDNTTDYAERRKIRTAIRELKKTTNNNNNNNLTQKSSISVSIDGGTSQMKTENVESTVTRLAVESKGREARHGSDDESKMTKTRYRRRMETEEEKEKAKEKESETKIRLEDINDEDVLSKLLKETTVYEERKKIRMAMKELRNRKEAQAQSSMSVEISPISSRTRSHATHIEVQPTESAKTEKSVTMVSESRVTSAQEEKEKEEDAKNRKTGVADELKTVETTVNIDDIKDENVLKQMLKDTEDFELKKKIRVVLRELRKKARESKAKEEETKEVTNGATHTTEMTLQLENKELEKRNGEVKVAEVKKTVSSPKVMPKMVIRTHSFKTPNKFDAPAVAKKQGNVVSTEKIQLNSTAKKDETLWGTPQTSDKKPPATDATRDSQKNLDVAKKAKTEISTSFVQPKTESPRPNTTAIEIPVIKENSSGKWSTPVKEERRKKSFEEIEDLAELESLLLKTKRADERLEIRAHIRQLKQRKTEEGIKKPATQVEDVQREKAKHQDNTDKMETAIMPATSEDINRNTEKSVKVDTREERPDPNTKITTTVMRLKDPNSEGEEVKEQTVVEQKTGSFVKKMTRTVTLKTNGESQPQMSVDYDEEPVKPIKTVVSRTIVAKETTDDYSSCYTSEEEEETVVKTDAKGKMYTSKTHKTLHRMEVTDIEKPKKDTKIQRVTSLRIPTTKYREPKKYKTDSESSDDEFDGGVLSRRAAATTRRKELENKGGATAKVKSEATSRLLNQSPQPLKDYNKGEEKQGKPSMFTSLLAGTADQRLPHLLR